MQVTAMLCAFLKEFAERKTRIKYTDTDNTPIAHSSAASDVSACAEVDEATKFAINRPLGLKMKRRPRPRTKHFEPSCEDLPRETRSKACDGSTMCEYEFSQPISNSNAWYREPLSEYVKLAPTWFPSHGCLGFLPEAPWTSHGCLESCQKCEQSRS